MYVIIHTPVCGHYVVYGPFQTENEAISWQENNIDFCECPLCVIKKMCDKVKEESAKRA